MKLLGRRRYNHMTRAFTSPHRWPAARASVAEARRDFTNIADDAAV